MVLYFEMVARGAEAHSKIKEVISERPQFPRRHSASELNEKCRGVTSERTHRRQFPGKQGSICSERLCVFEPGTKMGQVCRFRTRSLSGKSGSPLQTRLGFLKQWTTRDARKLLVVRCLPGLSARAASLYNVNKSKPAQQSG